MVKLLKPTVPAAPPVKLRLISPRQYRSHCGVCITWAIDTFNLATLALRAVREDSASHYCHDKRSTRYLVGDIRTGRVSVRLRHGRHFRCRADDPDAVGSQRRACTASPWPPRSTARWWARCSAAGRPTGSAASATLLWIGVLYFVSAVWSAALPRDVYSFIVARFIGGLGIGISTVAAPLYISEIAPPAHRGRLAGMFQFNIVFGILVAFVSNALLAGIGENAWRWMLGVAAFPVACSTPLLCFGIPESPRWLLGRKGDRARGPHGSAPDSTGARRRTQLEAKADEIVAASSRAAELRAVLDDDGCAVPILLAFLIAFFNQLSGINAVLYFAPRIFEMTGLGAKAALLQSVGIGRHQSRLHVRRPLADRPTRPAHAAVHRIVRLHRLARPDRLGVLHRSITPSFPPAFSPSSPRTPSGRARSSGCSSPRSSRTGIGRRGRRWAASRTGFSPRC